MRSAIIKGFGPTIFAVLSVFFIFSLAAPAAAQQKSQESQQPQQVQQQDKQAAQHKTKQSANQSKEAPQARADADYNLRLNDWVWVGYDWDRDGRVDYGEYIASFDIQRAREMSQKRSQQGMQMSKGKQGMVGPQGQRAMMRGQMGRHMQAADMRTVSGSIKSIKQTKFVGMDQEHMIARVQTQQGRTARVDLGPADNLRNANLREGDRITIQGRRGTINDQGFLMANMIRTDGQSINIRRAGDFNMKRYSGEIVKVKTAAPKSFQAPEQVFARIKLDQGPTTTVHLGPKDKLKGTDFQNLQGKEITFLAHKADIGNRTALVADQLRMDNRTIDLDWATIATKKGEGKFGEETRPQQQKMQQQGTQQGQQQ